MISKIINSEGSAKIQINGCLYDALMFKSYRATKRNVSDFYKAGLRLFCVVSSGVKSKLKIPYSLYGESWIDDESYDFDVVDKQLNMFIENAPDAYFALGLQLDTREWYLEKHKGVSNTFWMLSQTAADEQWRSLAMKYMKAFMDHVEKKYGEKVFGYYLLCGTTTEWFSDEDYEETHPTKLKAYREYLNDDKAEIPPKEKRELNKEIFFTENEALTKYRIFHANLISDTLLYFAKAAKEHLNFKKTIGVYFGYIFELGDPRLWNAGHLAYEKVFASEYVDIIISPSAYPYRAQNSISNIMVTADTLRAHNKLYFCEFDHITHLAPRYCEGVPIAGLDNKTKNETETISLMRRDYMMCLSKGYALWWFDMLEGWFYSDGMMNEIKRLIGLNKSLTNSKIKHIAEIAVFADSESLYYVNKNAGIGLCGLLKQIGALSALGAPIDVLSNMDFNEETIKKYKMFVFMTHYKLSEENKRLIGELKRRKVLCLWFYAPNVIKDDGTVDYKGIMEITDIKTGVTSKDNFCAVYKGDKFGFKFGHTFSPCVNDSDTETLAYFDRANEAAVAMKEYGNGFISVYSAVPNVNTALLRILARKIGVHLYNDTDDCNTYVNGSLIGVYHREQKDVKIFVKENGTYKDVFTGKDYIAKDGVIDIPLISEKERAKILVKV